jgi:hypothetical protein
MRKSPLILSVALSVHWRLKWKTLIFQIENQTGIII